MTTEYIVLRPRSYPNVIQLEKGKVPVCSTLSLDLPSRDLGHDPFEIMPSTDVSDSHFGGRTLCRVLPVSLSHSTAWLWVLYYIKLLITILYSAILRCP